MDLPEITNIGFGWRSHRAALQWWWALYTQPSASDTMGEAGDGMPSRHRLVIATAMLWHAGPYMLVLTECVRQVVCVWSGTAGPPSHVTPITHAFTLALGVMLGLAGGAAGCRFIALGAGLPVGAVGPILMWSLGSGGLIQLSVPVAGLVLGLLLGMTVSVSAAPVAAVPRAILTMWAGGFAVALLVALVAAAASTAHDGLVAGAATLAGFISGLYRVYHLPVSAVIALTGSTRLFTAIHPVFWDGLCMAPFVGLTKLLLGYYEADSEGCAKLLDRLLTEYPSQRNSARWAATAVVARLTARSQRLDKLDYYLSALPTGDNGYLAQVPALQAATAAISQQQRRVDAVTRPAFREHEVRALRGEILAFKGMVAGFHEPLVSEFRKAADAWLALADAQLAEAECQTSREPTPQVFRAGDPVRRDQEAFLPRLDVFGLIEHEVMSGVGCPGLLLYGRRRTGKSTVVENLDGYLPTKVVSAHLSMQDPRAFTSAEDLARLIADRTAEVWAPADQQSRPDDLPGLIRFLEGVDRQLAGEDRRLLLCIDEFEGLDHGIGEGRLPASLADTLRESIQQHRHLTWLFAGSHHFSELPNVAWASYLVSVRTVEVPMFTLDETRVLLADPLRHAKDEDVRAIGRRIGAAFWGKGGMDRIHQETGGWPHLVQLVASTTIDLANQRERSAADRALLEQALDKAIVSGDSVFYELMLQRSHEYPEAKPWLDGFVRRDRLPLPDEALWQVLRRHQLVVERHGQAELRVPLIQRWLRNRL